VHLLVEVRKVVLASPSLDLFVRSIRMPVVVGAVAVPLMQPLLVVALELVVEDDAVDACAALRETLCSAFVRAINLKIVFKLSLALEAVPKRLTTTLVAVTMMFEEVAAFLCERHGVLARAGRERF